MLRHHNKTTVQVGRYCITYYFSLLRHECREPSAEAVAEVLKEDVQQHEQEGLATLVEHEAQPAVWTPTPARRTRSGCITIARDGTRGRIQGGEGG